METHPCPKCNEPMDEGTMSGSGDGYSGYLSKRLTGMLRTVTKISNARACLNCGYVELYLDPQELKKRIS